jgi:hypothetical protein
MVQERGKRIGAQLEQVQFFIDAPSPMVTLFNSGLERLLILSKRGRTNHAGRGSRGLREDGERWANLRGQRSLQIRADGCV